MCVRLPILPNNDTVHESLAKNFKMRYERWQIDKEARPSMHDDDEDRWMMDGWMMIDG